MYSNTVYLQYSNLKDYQWVRCTHNTLAQGSSKDCTTFGLERFRALSQSVHLSSTLCRLLPARPNKRGTKKHDICGAGLTSCLGSMPFFLFFTPFFCIVFLGDPRGKRNNFPSQTFGGHHYFCWGNEGNI